MGFFHYPFIILCLNRKILFIKEITQKISWIKQSFDIVNKKKEFIWTLSFILRAVLFSIDTLLEIF